MQAVHRRHDISDRVWELLEPHLPGRKGTHGVTACDNRSFLNAVFWILCTEAPWRELPPDYGDWKNTHRRFCRWRDAEVWEILLEILVAKPDFEWLMIDASHIKVHPHAVGAHGGNQDMGRTKGRLNSKIHLAVDAHGMPVRMFVTAGTTADCSQACRLVEGITAEYLLTDKGDDSDTLMELLKKNGIQPVIPPRKNRKNLRRYDKYIYRLRHLVENVFLELKRWRGIATRYVKNTASFLAAVHIRCIAIWTKIK